jgi:hypothetical protein
LLLTYSGHGGQIPDVNGDEADQQDETWVLFDRELIDDELYQLWSQFAAGVRIFMLSDSCHSGTVARMMFYSQVREFDPAAKRLAATRDKPPVFRAIPADLQQRVYLRNARTYNSAQWVAGRSERASIGASVILISGCLDNQLSSDGDGNGLFTATLLQVWNNGAFDGSHYAFWKKILERMPSYQSPNYFKVGTDDTAFETMRPFVLTDGAPTGAGTPSVSCSTSTVSRSDDPPTFTVDRGGNPYYVFEITSEPDLFDYYANGSRRTSANFYATWSDPDAPARLTAPTYTLPEATWDALKAADRLYFRIGTTSSDTGWDNYTVSTPDDQGVSAPSIEITGEESLWDRGRAPSRGMQMA